MTLENVAAVTGPELTPATTVVVCSTPAVDALHAALGFEVAPVAALRTPADSRSTGR